MHTFNDDNLHKFNENLCNAKWSSFRNMEDPDEAYNNNIEEYSGIYIACFTLKVLKGKQVSIIQIWRQNINGSNGDR